MYIHPPFIKQKKKKKKKSSKNQKIVNNLVSTSKYIFNICNRINVFFHFFQRSNLIEDVFIQKIESKMISLSLLFFPLFSLSLKQKNFKLYSISPFLFSLSNISLTSSHHSLVSSRLFNIYSNHPVFLGVLHQSLLNLNLHSIYFKHITAPLLQGSFYRVTLNSLQFDKIHISSGNSNHCSDLININTSDCLPVFFDCNVIIRNCRIENFFPTVDNKISTTRSSVIQSYGANISIDHSSFLYCNSNSSPVLFSALSDINFLFSNFSFNYGETEGVFSMTRSTGTAKSCFFGNNEANENGVCSISESMFYFNSNAIIHNRADVNSIVFLILSNSTFNHNYFVANRIKGIFYGIVSIYDDIKISTNTSFIRCVFSLNKEIHEDSGDIESSKEFAINKQSLKLSRKDTISKNDQSVYSILYRGDDSVVLDHCVFDTPFKQSIILYDGGSLINISSVFGQSLQTPYDVFDTIPFFSSKGFKMDFDSSKSILYSILVLVFISFLITAVVYGLTRITGRFF